VSEAYRRAGVDLEAASRAVGMIRDLAAGATRPEVIEGVGGFAGLFRLGSGRYLAAATDGVGTKLEIARMAGRLDSVGIDLVAMCADDVVCTGAEPMLFLDYLAVGRLVPEHVAEVVAGVAEGCRRAGCALLGGETAEHPGVMDADRLDLAGFCVGVVGEEELLGPARVREGDRLVGLASSGLHSNGFSLVRSALLAQGPAVLEGVPQGFDRPLAELLLEPTAVYAPLVRSLAAGRRIHAAAHITGGGLPENAARILPSGLAARLERGAWSVPAVFELVRRSARISDRDMFATFNMGIGMVLAVPVGSVDEVLDAAAGSGARVIGSVVPGTGVELV
jgi:phosphoribosylformylglycinamidine cyclo-ligase